MANTNALQWNSAAVNQETDSQYASDPQRTGGAGTDSILPSATFNKFAYNVSTYVAALGQMMANKGFSTSDADLSVLTAAFSNLLTTADQKAALTLVPYSPTPTLNAATSNGFYMPLSGNSAVQSIALMTGGQVVGIIYQQDSVGGRVVTFPSSYYGLSTPDPAPNSVSVQFLTFDSYSNTVQALGPLVSSNGIFVSGGGNFSGSVIAEAANFASVLDCNGTANVTGSVNSGSVHTGALSAAAITATSISLTQAVSAASAAIAGALSAASTSVSGLLNTGSLQIGGSAPAGTVLTGNGTSFVPLAPTVLASGPGWTTLPNGDIQQYGSIAMPTVGYTSTANVVFPRTFPNGVKSIVVTPDNVPGTSTNLLATSAINRTLSGFTAYANTGFSDQPISYGVNVDWVAVGS